MQDRIGALEAALSTSALNERAILDAWGGDPLQQLLANLEAQRTGPKDLFSAVRQISQVKERRTSLLQQEVSELKSMALEPSYDSSIQEEVMTLRHEVSVLRKKCASLPAAVQRDKLTPQPPNNEELERVERGRRDALQQLEGAEKGKQEALFELTRFRGHLEAKEMEVHQLSEEVRALRHENAALSKALQTERARAADAIHGSADARRGVESLGSDLALAMQREKEVQERLAQMTHDMAALHATCMQQQRDIQSAARLAEQQAGRLEGELGKERAMHAAEVADLRMRLQALEQAESRMQEVHGELIEAKSRAASLAFTKEEVERRLALLSGREEERQAQLDVCQARVRQLEAELDQRSADAAAAQMTGDHVTKVLLSVRQEAQRLRQTGQALQEKEAGLEAERERMAAEMDRLRAALDEARRDAAVAQHDLAQRDVTLEGLQGRCAAAEKEAKECKALVRTLEEELAMRDQVDRHKTRVISTLQLNKEDLHGELRRMGAMWEQVASDLAAGNEKSDAVELLSGRVSELVVSLKEQAALTASLYQQLADKDAVRRRAMEAEARLEVMGAALRVKDAALLAKEEELDGMRLLASAAGPGRGGHTPRGAEDAAARLAIAQKEKELLLARRSEDSAHMEALQNRVRELEAAAGLAEPGPLRDSTRERGSRPGRRSSVESGGRSGESDAEGGRADAELDEARQAAGRLRQQVAALEDEVAALRAERAELDDAARRGTDEAMAAARLRQDKAALEAVVASLNRRAEEAEAESRGTAEDRRSLETLVAQLNQQLDEAEETIASLRARAADLEAQVNRAEQVIVAQQARLAAAAELEGAKARAQGLELEAEVGQQRMRAVLQELEAERERRAEAELRLAGLEKDKAEALELANQAVSDAEACYLNQEALRAEAARQARLAADTRRRLVAAKASAVRQLIAQLDHQSLTVALAAWIQDHQAAVMQRLVARSRQPGAPSYPAAAPSHPGYIIASHAV